MLFKRDLGPGVGVKRAVAFRVNARFRYQLMAGIVAATMAFAPSALAEFFDGNQIHAICDKTSSEHDGSFCYGYMAGAIDSINKPGSSTICAQGEVKMRQVRDIVVKHLVDHPERRHLGAHTLAEEALREAWPC